MLPHWVYFLHPASLCSASLRCDHNVSVVTLADPSCLLACHAYVCPVSLPPLPLPPPVCLTACPLCLPVPLPPSLPPPQYVFNTFAAALRGSLQSHGSALGFGARLRSLEDEHCKSCDTDVGETAVAVVLKELSALAQSSRTWLGSVVWVGLGVLQQRK